jgi:hypothetical protein
MKTEITGVPIDCNTARKKDYNHLSGNAPDRRRPAGVDNDSFFTGVAFIEFEKLVCLVV